jgi:hypothetical protein
MGIDRVATFQNLRPVVLKLLWSDGGQKPKFATMDAQDGALATGHLPSRLEDGTIAAKDKH